MASTMRQTTDPPTAAAPQTAPLATKTPEPPRKARREGRMARRAVLVGAATAALAGAGALVAPRAITALEAEAQSLARAAIQREIGELEGVSLDAAIRAAELTRIAVKVIVLPLARFVALVGSSALDLLLETLDVARTAMATLRLDTAPIVAFRDVVASWRGGVAALPISLGSYMTADIDGAETYLRALKRLAGSPSLSSTSHDQG